MVNSVVTVVSGSKVVVVVGGVVDVVVCSVVVLNTSSVTSNVVVSVGFGVSGVKVVGFLGAWNKTIDGRSALVSLRSVDSASTVSPSGEAASGLFVKVISGRWLSKAYGGPQLALRNTESSLPFGTVIISGSAVSNSYGPWVELDTIRRS